MVRSTLSYWKKRSYYAGLRRLPSFALSNGDSVNASGAGIYKSGCVTIGSTSYSKFSSKTNSFYGNAAAITSDSAYANARKVMASIPRFVDAIAKVVKPKDASGYARTLKGLIATYKLTDYDVVTIKGVLDTGASGYRVTALQHLLKAAGYSTKITRQVRLRHPLRGEEVPEGQEARSGRPGRLAHPFSLVLEAQRRHQRLAVQCPQRPAGWTGLSAPPVAAGSARSP